ncbi:hypothetical protein [Ferrovibrio sp.]|uniref:hypothetical protein n=1 Tax=Ferrovibrio sp. TaxID=1917215 RepID=UPI00312001DD
MLLPAAAPAMDGHVGRDGTVLLVDGPFSTGLSKSFRLRLIEAVVAAGDDLPVILLLNSEGGLEREAADIRAVIALFRASGVVFEARVNYLQRCDALCLGIADAANHRRIDLGAASPLPPAR